MNCRFKYHFFKSFLFLIIFYNSKINLYTQNNSFNSEEKKSINQNLGEQIYQFHFESALQYLKIIQKSEETNNNKILYLLHYYWWCMIAEYDEKSEIYFLKILESAKKLESVKTNNPNDLLFKIFIQLYDLRYSALKSNSIELAFKFKKLTEYINQSFGLEKSYPEFYFVTGLYAYFYEYIKNSNFMGKLYLTFLPSLPYKINYENYLLSCYQNKTVNSLLRWESLYFLFKIQFELEKKYDKSLSYIVKLCETFPDNYIFKYYYFKILKENFTDKYSEEMKNTELQLFLSKVCFNSNQKSKIKKLFENL
jgi:hypothetical protein